MTIHEAERKFRSLYYRQRLLKDFHLLESEVMSFIEVTGYKAFAGFKVEVVNGQIVLKKVHVNTQQLTFDFGKELKQ